MNRVAVLLFLEEERLLGPDSLARTLDEDLHDHVLHIYETHMLESRAGNEGKLLLVKVRQRQEEVLVYVPWNILLDELDWLPMVNDEEVGVCE